MARVSKYAIILVSLLLLILTGCTSKQVKEAYKSKDSVLIDKYIRHIDNYLTENNELVFNNSKELSSETLYEFIHFINAKERMNIVKYDGGKFVITKPGAEWIFERFFKSYRFNENEIIDYDSSKEIFTGPKRRYNFDSDELECIYISSKKISKGNLVVVVDYYDPFDIQKLSKLYSKTYTIRIDEYGYKYLSVAKEESKINSKSVTDYSYYLSYYVKPLVSSGLAEHTWSRAEELDANCLLKYACTPFLNANINYDEYLVKEGNSSCLHIPARIIEKQLYQKFDLPNNFLKLTDAYNPKTNSYVTGFGSYGLGYEPIIDVKNVVEENKNIIITFERTNPSESSNSNKSLVELTIDDSGERFKYISCKVIE